MRILVVSELWQGADSYAYVRAFRRAGHSVAVVDSAPFLATGWRATPLRVMRRLMEPWLVREFNRSLLAEAEHLRPHLFFAFKGSYVTRETLERIKRLGAVAIDLYPDVSFTAHTKHLPATLPGYDWIFTTKTFGLRDMERQLGVTDASFLPPAFDPEVHAPFALDQSDLERYAADISFIGTWSPKKEQTLRHVRRALPGATMKIWGWHWEKATSPELKDAIQFQVVNGPEYAKCIRASRINLGLLSEIVDGASSGDLITARTFHIPASGGFMLHERTPEVAQYFTDGEDCALFSTLDELVERAAFFLEHEAERRQVAENGRSRSEAAGYSVDRAAAEVLAKYAALADHTERAEGPTGKR